VTGANSGIGEGVARALAAAGADVAVNYVARPEDAARVVAELKRLGVTAMAIRADVSRETEVRAMFQEMIAAWGSIDILVSNAGLERNAALVDMTLDQSPTAGSASPRTSGRPWRGSSRTMPTTSTGRRSSSTAG
jgi:glucose 1-dehydrogenase